MKKCMSVEMYHFFPYSYIFSVLKIIISFTISVLKNYLYIINLKMFYTYHKRIENKNILYYQLIIFHYIYDFEGSY